MDEIDRSDDRKKKHTVLCCDPNEVAKIVTCLSELKDTIDCVLDCTHDHSSGIKERIILCKLLDEIRQIENKLDNPLFGLNEIKSEIIDINDIITNSTFGLKEIKNEVRDIESLLNNQFFGLNEIKNEIITINDLLNNATFGIPELKNEIRIIENSTTTTNNLLTNEIFGLNEIKNEIRGIENTLGDLPNTNININTINNTVNIINDTLNNSIFGLNEIKNEIRNIENQTVLLTNDIFGLNEIKNEIRFIENQSGLLTNELFGLNEIKNEIRGIENMLAGGPNRFLSCNTDSVSICGLGVDNIIRPIKTDVNNVLATLPSASTHSQIGQLYSLPVIFSVPTTVLGILFSNPSTRTMYLDRIMGGARALPVNQPRSYIENTGITILKNVTVLDPGTPLFPTNLNTAFTDTPSVVVTESPGVGGGITIFRAIQLGEYASVDFDGRIVVAPNTNILIFFAFDVPPAGFGSAGYRGTITWYEL